METLPDQPTLRDIYEHARWWQTRGVFFDAGLRNHLHELDPDRTYLIVNFKNSAAQLLSEEVGKFVYAYKDTLLNLILFRADPETLSRLEFVQGLYNNGAITDSLTKRRRKRAKDAVTVG